MSTSITFTSIRSVSDEISEGDEILVKVIDVDKVGKIRLSRKEAMGQKGGDKEGGDDRSSGGGRSSERDSREGGGKGGRDHRR